MKPVAWWRRISFRVRLSSLVALAVGVAVALASLAAYVAVRHQLYSQLNQSLESEIVPATALVLGQAGPSSVTDRYPNSAVQVISTTNGRNFVVSPFIPPTLSVTQQQAVTALSPNESRVDDVTRDGVHYRVLTENVSEGVAIQVAQPLTDIIHSMSTLRLILWLVSFAGIAVAVVLGWIVGRTTMRPVERLTEAAEHVAATQDLGATIVDEGDDELARLARSFNSMLSALAQSRQAQAQLISDAGHELRTPLTSLRTNIEVLQRVPNLPEQERAALLGDVNAQLEELTTLIGDVVELARQDEQQHAEPIEVRLDVIVEKATERARRRAPLVTFRTELTAGSVRAQPALLERAVLNVLDNAAKWSPAGGTVTISLVRGDSWVLTVADEGPGIPAADLPHVFERFYRAASARPMPGSGLGLAIVRQVVTSHNGTVAIACPTTGGTVVRIELPIVAESEPEAVADPDPVSVGSANGAPAGDWGDEAPASVTPADASSLETDTEPVHRR